MKAVMFWPDPGMALPNPKLKQASMLLSFVHVAPPSRLRRMPFPFEAHMKI